MVKEKVFFIVQLSCMIAKHSKLVAEIEFEKTNTFL